jgi:hypothetical protein
LRTEFACGAVDVSMPEAHRAATRDFALHMHALVDNLEFPRRTTRGLMSV